MSNVQDKGGGKVDWETHSLRYLVCPPCASQWHLVRAKCVACDSAKDLAYYALESEAPHPVHPVPPVPAADARSGRREAARRRPAVQAEACEGCRTYLKILHVERDPGLEPAADARPRLRPRPGPGAAPGGAQSRTSDFRAFASSRTFLRRSSGRAIRPLSAR